MVSPGCKNCYAMRLAARFAVDGWSQGLIDLKTKKWSREGRLALHKLADPLRWRDPSTVFVNSMSDLFWDKFTNEEIAAVFGVMAACPQHVFIIATKRARRMREWFAWINPVGRDLLERLKNGGSLPPPPRLLIQNAALKALPSGPPWGIPARPGDHAWPLPNVWLLVSVENQEMANERIPALLQTPAAVRGISAEPLLGPLNLTLHGSQISGWDEDWKYDTLRGAEWASPHSEVEDGSSAKLDWVITGCESGPAGDVRETQTGWFRSLRRQCQEARVPFFFKQGKVTMEGIGGDWGDLRPGRIAEPPRLDGEYHQEWPQ